MLDVALRGFDIRVRIFFPALDRKKEILLHLWAGVVHAVAHIHGRISRVQINFQRFVLDPDVSSAIVVRGACAARPRNACLPRAAIGEERARSNGKRRHREQ